MKDFKKYKTVVVFGATRCNSKVSKEQEKRLRQIKKEIMKLYKEQKDIFALVSGEEQDG